MADNRSWGPGKGEKRLVEMTQTCIKELAKTTNAAQECDSVGLINKHVIISQPHSGVGVEQRREAGGLKQNWDHERGLFFFKVHPLPTDLMGDTCINIPLYKARNRPHSLVPWQAGACLTLLGTAPTVPPSTPIFKPLSSICTSNSAQKNSQCLQQQIFDNVRSASSCFSSVIFPNFTWNNFHSL